MKKLLASLVVALALLGAVPNSAKAAEVTSNLPRTVQCGYWVDMGYWRTVVVWDCYGFAHYSHVWVHNWVYVY